MYAMTRCDMDPAHCMYRRVVSFAMVMGFRTNKFLLCHHMLKWIGNATPPSIIESRESELRVVEAHTTARLYQNAKYVQGRL